MTTFTSCFVRAQTVGLDSTTQQEGVQELDVPLVVQPLRWFFCLLGCGSFPFVPCLPPYFGCFGLYMIFRVSSLLPESSQSHLLYINMLCLHLWNDAKVMSLFFSLKGHLWFWNSRGFKRTTKASNSIPPLEPLFLVVHIFIYFSKLWVC